MKAKKYVKKPVEIEAFKYDGDIIDSKGKVYAPKWAEEAYKNGTMFYSETEESPSELFIKTLEGNHHVSVGDYIIKGVKGELYPCKPDIFEETYKEVHCFTEHNFEESRELCQSQLR